MRSRWSLPLLALSLAIPVAASAGAPFETPVQPDVPVGPPEFEAPPEGRPVTAPPFDLELPTQHAADLPFDVPQGPPSPLPNDGAGIPDLVGVVDLPAGALDQVLDQAPPFGGEHGGSRHVTVVPEPATGALIVLGLAALAMRKRTS